MRSWVSDEVWRQLDPGVGRLSRRTMWRVGAAVAAGVLLLVAGLGVWTSGAIVPRLYWTPGQRVITPDEVMITMNLSNAGRSPVNVVDNGPPVPGLELRAIAGPFPVILEPQTGVMLTYTYRVTDCSAVPRGNWTPAVTVQRSWGRQTVAVPAQFGGFDWAEVCDLRDRAGE